MNLARYSKEYIEGVESFLDFAYSYGDPQEEEIQCPCAKCCNIRWTRRNVICYGFVKGNTRWINHGEWDIKLNVNDDMDYSRDVIDGLLNDQFRDVAQAEGVYDSPNEDAKKFYNLVEEASQELYPGCTGFSKLSFTVRLYLLKCLHGWSNESFTSLLELLKEVMPELNIPPSYNKIKSMVKNLDLDYEKIDACPNDCMLFRNDHKDDEFRHTRGASRYIKSPEVDSELEPSKKQHRVSAKTLRHFPLIPRLKRLFMCSKMADSLRWHDEERSKDGNLRHPDDGLAWKDFDWLHPNFALDCRNHNLLRHNRDVMHIEKNIVDSILGTLLDIPGKTKNHAKARYDLKDMGIRKNLHPKDTEDSKRTKFAKACFSMTNGEKSIFCGILKTEKLPDGSASNISRGVHTRFNRRARNNDGCDPSDAETVSLFPNKGVPLGAKKTDPFIIDSKSLSRAHAYLLGNCDGVQEYNRGPNSVAKRYFGYLINGYRFHVRQRDARRKTQTSGVTLVASTTSFASSKDKNLIAANLTYYGRIVDIVELDYYSHFKEEPFVLGSQVHQCFYVQDPYDQDRHFVMKTVPRDLFNMGDEIESNLPQSYENEPSEHLMGPSIPKDNGEVLLTRIDVLETIIDVPSEEFVT
ncbi:hypothetical protein MTR67_043152 [Solanum verrucosum]|uniref:Transposase-associated domain-containing protein n=1 Tax=Solanum verrucosum TaxID=315347 RepID=A0AAF0UP53_SOLVR|nr:hypothetical protein MTR67_043152 [Solanum verrucosum]